MELLALYLILANINGKTLKEAFVDLFTSTQRFLTENLILFIGYPIAITAIIYQCDAMGHGFSLVMLPFVAMALVKKFKLNLAMLALVFLFIFSLPVATITLLIPLHRLINFSLILGIVVLVVAQNYPYRLHNFMAKGKIFINVVYMFSFLIYFLPVVINPQEFLIVIIFLILLLISYAVIILSTKIRMRKELAVMLILVNNGSYEELLLFLKQQAHYYDYSEVSEYFVIDERLMPVALVDAISQKLTYYKTQNKIRAYACRAMERQIKISIVLDD